MNSAGTSSSAGSCSAGAASAAAGAGASGAGAAASLPSVVEAALLPGLVGWGRTRQLLLLGEVYEAEEAARWGLVERVVPDGDLDAAVGEWLDALLLATPRAIRLQKALIRKWEDLPVTDAVRAGIDAFAAAYETDEPARAMAAFRAERRRAKGG